VKNPGFISFLEEDGSYFKFRESWGGTHEGLADAEKVVFHTSSINLVIEVISLAILGTQ
jgi:hypothetical protein